MITEAIFDKKLKNKRILLLCPSFFGYEKIILENMESMGAEVTYYDERPTNSSFDRAVGKKFPHYLENKFKKYFEKIIKDTDDFDYVFIVKCDCIGVSVLREMKTKYKSAKFCLYLWDSLKNNKGIQSKYQYFDYRFTFDRIDSVNNSNDLMFRPLFYHGSYDRIDHYDYDFCFCGTAHSDRYYILDKISEYCDANRIKIYKFLYLHAKFVFYYYKLFRKGFKKAHIKEFAFKNMDYKVMKEIENSSKVIIDVEHPNQTGLTIRTIEIALGMNKKLITTNQDIKNYDFYNTNNILVIDRKNPIIEEEFIKSPIIDIPEPIRLRYNIKNWILEIIGEKVL